MTIPFVKAKWFTDTGTTGRKIRKVVIHSMEAPEKGDTAESVAAYFARGTVKASAHLCIDADSAVRCVRDMDVAWAAPGANSDGLQYEHAGYARQTGDQWLDPYSLRMLRRSARLAARDCQQHNIPARFVTAAEMKANPNATGITTHAEVTKAYGQSTHTDPGKGFPIEKYIGWVQAELMPKTHVVKPGETVTDVAKQHGISVVKLWRMNRARIFTGERLRVR